MLAAHSAGQGISPKLHGNVVTRRAAMEWLILFMFAAYLLIDSVNGLLVKSVGLPSVISPLFKQGLLLLLLLYALIFERNRAILCSAILAALLVWALARFYTVDSLHFTFALQEAVKAIYLFVVVVVVGSFRTMTQTAINAIVTASLCVVMLNILATFAGLGYSTYSGGLGAKGFFYAGNALSGVLVICACLFLCRAYLKSLFRFVCYFCFFLALAVIIGTKSGILALFIIAALVMLVNADARMVLLSAFAALLLVAFVVAFQEQIVSNPVYERLVFFYDTGGMQRALFSGREEKLLVIWELFYNANWAQVLLGLDIPTMQRAGVTRVEFDWMDLLLNFGLIFTLAVYAAYIYLFLLLFKAPPGPLKQATIIASVVLFFISCIAGHVLYNGTVTPLWAILLAATLNRKVSPQY